MEFLELSPSWKDFAHWGCGPIGVVGRELLGTGEPVSARHEGASKLDRYSKTYLFGRDTEALFNDASQIKGYPEPKGEMLELLQAEENEAASQGYLLWQKMRGEDFTKAPIEFEWHPPYVHNNQAGIHIDTRAASSLEGLYCAGDVIGGGWRQSSGGAFVFGARAGTNAAVHALGRKKAEIDPEQVEEEKRPFIRATEMAPRKGYSWIELEDKARQIISEYGCPFTSDAKITRGMKHLDRIEREYLPLIYARSSREMLRVGEVRSTFWIARAHLTCALERKESRSPYVSVFYKRGYPDQDDKNWKKHSVLRNEEGRMVYRTKAVRGL
jgi:succinate dehydrogenase/fumarate reductase flavoprotein subunit